MAKATPQIKTEVVGITLELTKAEAVALLAKLADSVDRTIHDEIHFGLYGVRINPALSTHPYDPTALNPVPVNGLDIGDVVEIINTSETSGELEVGELVRVDYVGNHHALVHPLDQPYASYVIHGYVHIDVQG